MTGRGKGGKGLGKGGAKRHRKVLRDNIQGITKPAIEDGYRHGRRLRSQTPGPHSLRFRRLNNSFAFFTIPKRPFSGPPNLQRNVLLLPYKFDLSLKFGITETFGFINSW